MTFPSLHTDLLDLLRRYALLRRLIILTWHVVGTLAAYYVAFFLRFEGGIDPASRELLMRTLPVLLIVNITVFSLFRLHSGMWSYFSVVDLGRVLAALVLATVAFVIVVFSMLQFSFFGYPRSVFAINFMLMAAWMTGARLAVRLLREGRLCFWRRAAGEGARVLLVGHLDDVDEVVRAWETAGGVLRGIVTDEARGHSLTVRGLPVDGPVSEIGTIAQRLGADRILILPPYTRPKQISQIMDDCERTGVAATYQMIPAMSDLAAGRVRIETIRRVEIEDLLGRPTITFGRQTVREMIAGRVVMITGAGGSIGAELARQVVHYAPRTLVLFEVSEFNLYSIDMELRQAWPDVPIVSVAGDIGHEDHVRYVLRQHGVQILYHAAAYKHVPIMEDNVDACILNNTVGTARIAEQAERSGVERFVLISSDKAVRPTSVMGASKRLAERVIQERPVSKTCFVTVRFGNVLGSSGSVIPLFRKQIERGGPVTVTSPNMTRFFMSIPEAVDLVLQASTIGADHDILVLEMGESIRIADMAKRLIELSGFKVGEDIEIVYTGIRPGEKEFEELMTDNENVVRTPYEKIWVMQKQPGASAPAVNLDRLGRLIEARDVDGLRRELVRLIPDAYPTIARGT